MQLKFLLGSPGGSALGWEPTHGTAVLLPSRSVLPSKFSTTLCAVDPSTRGVSRGSRDVHPTLSWHWYQPCAAYGVSCVLALSSWAVHSSSALPASLCVCRGGLGQNNIIIENKPPPPHTHTINYFIIVGLSHIIHHANKIVEADFQTLVGSSHGRV